MPFTRPTLDELITRVESGVSTRLGIGPLLPRSVLKVLARVIAGVGNGVHGHLDFLQRQIIPDTAEDEYLERWAGIFGIVRAPAAKATGSATFTGTAGTLIGSGTQLSRTDGQLYELVSDATIGSGGSVSGTVRALVAGELGEAAASTVLTLTSPIADVDDDATVDAGAIIGGSDVETDESLRDRLLLELQSPDNGCSESAYRRRALAVPEVTRVWVVGNYLGAGTVGVYFTVDNDAAGPIPNAAKIAEVQAVLDDPEFLPPAVQVDALAPIALTQNFTIALSPNTAAVQSAVEEAITDLLFRSSEVSTDFPISKLREAVSTADGEDDHDITVPAADVSVSTGELLLPGTFTFSTL